MRVLCVGRFVLEIVFITYHFIVIVTKNCPYANVFILSDKINYKVPYFVITVRGVATDF